MLLSNCSPFLLGQFLLDGSCGFLGCNIRAELTGAARSGYDGPMSDIVPADFTDKLARLKSALGQLGRFL